MTFCHYNENPDQAMDKILHPEAIERLRKYMRQYLEKRSIGVGKTVERMHQIVPRWSHEDYQKHISKSLSDANLRNFVQFPPKSNLIENARLFVHVFIWITTPAYRDAWGQSDLIEDDPAGSALPGDSLVSPTSIRG